MVRNAWKCGMAGLVVLTVGFALPAADNAAPEGFTALFNGKDISGWRGCSWPSTRTSSAASVPPVRMAAASVAA